MKKVTQKQQRGNMIMIRDLLEKEWIPEWIPFLGAVAHFKQIIKAGYGSINGSNTANHACHRHNKINRI